MSGFQKFIFIGNLTRDAELKQIGENELCKFSVAVNGYRDTVEYFDCNWWRPNAASQYLNRGQSVCVEGEIQTERWEKDGEKKSKAVVNVRTITLLGGKKEEKPQEDFVATPF